MEREDSLNHFLKTLRLLIKFQNLTGDIFFAEKTDRLINDLAVSYLSVHSDRGDNVAQYLGEIYKSMGVTDSIIEIIDEMNYLSLNKNHPLSLRIKLNLLQIKLNMVKLRNNQIPRLKTIEKASNTLNGEHIPGQVNRPKRPSVTRKKMEFSKSKQKILEFIKSSPDIRTKDIIFEFNSVSDRTVKRNLTELLQAGLIKKRIDNKAVYYSSSD